MMAKSLSVVIPAYRDASMISEVVSSLLTVVKSEVGELEIIIVEDGSPDNTAEVCRCLANKYPQVKIICHPKNMGYGRTLRDGFEAATKEFVFYTDGDNQYDLTQLPSALKLLEEVKVDAVLGYRYPRSDGIFRFLVSKVYNYLFRIVFPVYVRDVNCSFKLVKNNVMKMLRLSSESAFIDAEIVWGLKNKGFKFKEMPVSNFSNKFRRSNFVNPRRTLEILNEMFRKKFCS